MKPTTQRFTLKDRQGSEHAYEMATFGGIEGARLMFNIHAALGDALAGALFAVFMGEDTAEFDARLLKTTATQILMKLDNLMPQLLENTSRDGVALATNGKLTKGFDAAFGCNYGEMNEAISEVIDRNGFLELSDILKILPPGIRVKALAALPASNESESSTPNALVGRG